MNRILELAVKSMENSIQKILHFYKQHPIKKKLKFREHPGYYAEKIHDG
jgi:hypothetical protein